MKILKYLLGILAALIIIFIAIGLIIPSANYSSEIVVDKPLNEAWAVMNDESKLDQWLQGITKIEAVSGEKGTVGAVTKYTFEDNGQESQIIETIKSMEEHDHVAMDFNMEGVMNMDYRVDFSEQDGKTHIKSTTTTKGEGIMMRSMVPFMKGTMQKQEDQNMANLKKLIEGNTTNYFPIVEDATEEMEDEQNDSEE